MKISKRNNRTLTAWVETDDGSEEVFIRESLDRGKDVQTVAITKEELKRIIDSWELLK